LVDIILLSFKVLLFTAQKTVNLIQAEQKVLQQQIHRLTLLGFSSKMLKSWMIKTIMTHLIVYCALIDNDKNLITLFYTFKLP